jgi:putative ABC transport system ATP-binding protein
VIVAQSLVKTYTLGGNVVRALDGISFEIASGEMVAIRGPSGSGKSTLMHIIGCLDTPDSGSYVLGGDDVSRMPKDRLAEVRNQHIGFVFQTFNLLPRMTALENVELPIHYAGRHDAKDRAAEALKIVGLADRMEHEPNQLSGGQRQRVAIARAIVTTPKILLADEPTGALDSKTGEEILSLFKSLNDQGRTIIIVTHDAAIARHCKREIFLRDGRITEPAQPCEPDPAAVVEASGASA